MARHRIFLMNKHKNRLIMLFLSILVLFCIILSAIFTNRYLLDIGRANIDAFTLSMHSLLTSIDHSLQEAGNLALLAGLEKNVRDALESLQSEPKDSFEYMYQSHWLKEDLNNFINAHSYISNIIPITLNGIFLNDALVYESEKMQDMIHLDRLQSTGDPIMFFGSVNPLYNTPSNRVYSCVRKIYAMRGPRKVIGYIQVDIQPDRIDNTLQSALSGNADAICLYDDTGEVIGAFGKVWLFGEDDYADTVSGDIVHGQDGKFLKIRISSDYSGWEIISWVAYDRFFDNTIAIMTSIYVAVSACLFFSVVFVIRILKQTHLPLNKIIDGMHEIERGNFNAHVDVCTGDEFETIAAGLNRMSGQLKELLDRLVREQTKKKDAEMLALQAQINPHFLNNTLMAIRYLARKGENIKCEKITIALAELCSASMRNSKKLLTLDEELRLAKDYFQILQVRYGDTITMSVHMSEALNQCLIPKFTLQPLIENAVFHGLSLNKSGKISVEIAEQNETLHILVEDNGVGMPQQKVNALNAHLSGIYMDKIYKTGTFNHIGMENVSNRIKMEFGLQYGLQIFSDLGQRTKIVIHIPKRFAERETEERYS